MKRNKTRLQERQTSAAARAEKVRTPAQQLQHLDTLFGVGQGAAKERKKLAAKLAKVKS